MRAAGRLELGQPGQLFVDLALLTGMQEQLDGAADLRRVATNLLARGVEPAVGFRPGLRVAVGAVPLVGMAGDSRSIFGFSPPITIGGCGCCNGLGSHSASVSV
jgi:hypothetical protein